VTAAVVVTRTPADEAGVGAKESKVKTKAGSGASMSATTTTTTSGGSGRASKQLPSVHPLEVVATSGVLRHVCWLLVHRCALVRGAAKAVLSACLDAVVSSESAGRASKMASQAATREEARQAGVVGGAGRNTSRRDSRRTSSAAAAAAAAATATPLAKHTPGSGFAASFLQVSTDLKQPRYGANIGHVMHPSTPQPSLIPFPHSCFLLLPPPPPPPLRHVRPSGQPSWSRELCLYWRACASVTLCQV
jgi:predicted metal-dependent phosphotriesterase family hydrolase